MFTGKYRGNKGNVRRPHLACPKMKDIKNPGLSVVLERKSTLKVQTRNQGGQYHAVSTPYEETPTGSILGLVSQAQRKHLKEQKKGADA